MGSRDDSDGHLVYRTLLIRIEGMASRSLVERRRELAQLFRDHDATQEPALDQGLPGAVAGAGPALHFHDRHGSPELEHGPQDARLLLVLLLQLADGKRREVARSMHFEVRQPPLSALLGNGR